MPTVNGKIKGGNTIGVVSINFSSSLLQAEVRSEIELLLLRDPDINHASTGNTLDAKTSIYPTTNLCHFIPVPCAGSQGAQLARDRKHKSIQGRKSVGSTHQIPDAAVGGKVELLPFRRRRTPRRTRACSRTTPLQRNSVGEWGSTARRRINSASRVLERPDCDPADEEALVAAQAVQGQGGLAVQGDPVRLAWAIVRPPRSPMFSPIVERAPLTCWPGSWAGSNALYCSIRSLARLSNSAAVGVGPPVVEVAFAVVLRTLVIEARGRSRGRSRRRCRRS